MQENFDPKQFDQLIIQRLPTLMRQNPQIQELVLEFAQQKFAERKETEDKFYQMLGELKRDREEQARKWNEHKIEEARRWEEHKAEESRKWEEQNRKWDELVAEEARKWEEQNRKWEEQNRKWNEWSRKWDEHVAEEARKFDKVHEDIRAILQKQDNKFGAIGARWGIQSENAFRLGLASILEKSFGVEVINVNEYDDEGMVFGRPDQVELDVIVQNGLLIICEIKSSIDKAGMYIFERKVRFYEKRHQRQANRMLVISPMVDLRARSVAEKLGIEVYGDSMEITSL